jgi:hypothetical protein
VLGELSVADPDLPTRADLRITFAAGEAVPDRNAVTAALEAAFAWLGGRAESGGSAEQRTLSFGKLLRLLPPPVGQGEPLSDESAQPLPNASDKYDVALFIEQANGLTRMLTAPGDSYELGPRERLALNSVNVEVRS